MRALFLPLAALFVWMLGANPAAAQAPLDCAVYPQSICENTEIQALEGERSALVEHLTAFDPQNPALAGEQTWLDALGACGEDANCYRAGYLNHNEMLRQAVAALPMAPAAETEAAPEEPPGAASVEDAPAAPEDAAPARQRPRRETPERVGDDAYVPAGLPGWGFFTAIGATTLMLYALLRARRRNREALRTHEQAGHDSWG